jgi:hypothetical protein
VGGIPVAHHPPEDGIDRLGRLHAPNQSQGLSGDGEKVLWLFVASWVPSEEQSRSRCGSPRSHKKSHDPKKPQQFRRKNRCKSFTHSFLSSRGERIRTFDLLVPKKLTVPAKKP